MVLQSHRADHLSGWLGRCCESVQSWAVENSFAYEHCGDELFEYLPTGLRRKYCEQPVVLTDLARLLWLQRKLDEGYDRAIWCDADILFFQPMQPAGAMDTFGRECWVQRTGGRLRAYRKIHNAFMSFLRGSSTLPFYIERATSLLESADAPVVPQFIGPKLLTAWHNIAPFGVEERVGMLSPLAMDDLLGNREPALTLLLNGHSRELCALNLSASLAGRESDGVQFEDSDYDRLIDGLLGGEFAEKLRMAV